MRCLRSHLWLLHQPHAVGVWSAADLVVVARTCHVAVIVRGRPLASKAISAKTTCSPVLHAEILETLACRVAPFKIMAPLCTLMTIRSLAVPTTTRDHVRQIANAFGTIRLLNMLFVVVTTAIVRFGNWRRRWSWRRVHTVDELARWETRCLCDALPPRTSCQTYRWPPVVWCQRAVR